MVWAHCRVDECSLYSVRWLRDAMIRYSGMGACCTLPWMPLREIVVTSVIKFSSIRYI